MRKVLASAFLLLAFGCASSSKRPDTVAQPDVSVRQAGPTFIGSTLSTTLSFDVQVKNNASVPLTLRQVELTSPAQNTYGIARTTKVFNEVIQPGQTRTVGMTADAFANTTRTDREPLSIRALVRFEAAGKTWQEIAASF